jgi:hypothetical protein
VPRSPEQPSSVVLRPEAELLLACARTTMDADQAARAGTLLHRDLDWPYLTRTAIRHGVAPLLYRSLTTSLQEEAPEGVLTLLRPHFHANRLHNTVLTGELLRLLAALEARDIRAIPFKGPALAAAVYGDISLRQFTDLDILIRKKDLPRASELLRARGYLLAGTSQSPAGLAATEGEYHCTFAHPSGSFGVELHWAFTAPYFAWRFDLEGMWDRVEALPLLGTTVRTLAATDLLPVLCVHGAKHCWERLEWLCSIAELMRVAAAESWGAVLEKARQLGGERLLLQGLVLGRELLGAALPSAVEQRLRKRPVSRALVPQVCRWLFAENEPITKLQRHMFYVSARERLRDRVTYLFHHLRNVNAKDRPRLALSGLLSRLYRPIRLVATYGNPWPLLKSLAERPRT